MYVYFFASGTPIQHSVKYFICYSKGYTQKLSEVCVLLDRIWEAIQILFLDSIKKYISPTFTEYIFFVLHLCDNGRSSKHEKSALDLEKGPDL